jgi:hypothetical protein
MSTTKNDVPSEVREAVEIILDGANAERSFEGRVLLDSPLAFRDFARRALNANWMKPEVFAKILTATNTIQTYYNERAGYDAAAQAMKEQIIP